MENDEHFKTQNGNVVTMVYGLGMVTVTGENKEIYCVKFRTEHEF